MIRPLLILTTIAYWCLMFIITHLPPARVPKLRVSDKVEHLAAFMLLGGLLYLCLKPKVHHTLLAVALIGAAYGAFDELTQPLVGRRCELLDWVCDFTGILIGASGVALAMKLLAAAELRAVSPSPSGRPPG